MAFRTGLSGAGRDVVYLILVGAVGGLGWTFCLKRKGLKP